VRLLLDTHAAIWWLADDDRLGHDAARLLAGGAHEVLLSAAVVLEVAIKRSLGKLSTPDAFGPTLLEGGARPLPVTLEHAEAVEALPWHHRDPFDRLLVAQAAIEGVAVVSGDPALRPYGIPLVW